MIHASVCGRPTRAFATSKGSLMECYSYECMDLQSCGVDLDVQVSLPRRASLVTGRCDSSGDNGLNLPASKQKRPREAPGG
jgi:hypothetical protein